MKASAAASSQATVPPKLTKRRSGKGITVLSERKLNLGQKLTVVSGDIVDVKADAIVHPTSANYSMSGEVGNRLATVGGAEFLTEINNLRQREGEIPHLGGKYPLPYFIPG